MLLVNKEKTHCPPPPRNPTPTLNCVAGQQREDTLPPHPETRHPPTLNCVAGQQRDDTLPPHPETRKTFWNLFSTISCLSGPSDSLCFCTNNLCHGHKPFSWLVGMVPGNRGHDPRSFDHGMCSPLEDGHGLVDCRRCLFGARILPADGGPAHISVKLRKMHTTLFPGAWMSVASKDLPFRLGRVGPRRHFRYGPKSICIAHRQSPPAQQSITRHTRPNSNRQGGTLRKRDCVGCHSLMFGGKMGYGHHRACHVPSLAQNEASSPFWQYAAFGFPFEPPAGYQETQASTTICAIGRMRAHR